jgi:Na+/proline symporter
MATVTLSDIWPRLVSRQPDVTEGRWITLGFGVLCTGIACLGRQFGNILNASILVGSLVGGSLVGTFLLGMLMRRVTAMGALAGMFGGFATAIYLWCATDIASLWYSVFSFVVVFIIGIAVSLFQPCPPSEKINGLVIGTSGKHE